MSARVIAYDIGERNLGYCVADVKRGAAVRVTVHALGVSDSGTRCSNARLAARAAALAHARTSAVATAAAPGPATIVIERQYTLNRRASLIEAALYALHASDSCVEAGPKRVARDFCLRHGRREKKQDAVRVVDALLSNTALTRIAHADAVRAYIGAKKRDDMADAALLVYWHAGCAKNFCALARRTQSSRKGAARKKRRTFSPRKKRRTT